MYSLHDMFSINNITELCPHASSQTGFWTLGFTSMMTQNMIGIKEDGHDCVTL